MKEQAGVRHLAKERLDFVEFGHRDSNQEPFGRQIEAVCGIDDLRTQVGWCWSFLFWPSPYLLPLPLK